MPRKPQIQLQAESKTPFSVKDHISGYCLTWHKDGSSRSLGVGGGKMLHQRPFLPVMQLPGTHLSWRGSETEKYICFMSNRINFLDLFALRARDEVNMQYVHKTPVSASLANMSTINSCTMSIAFHFGFEHTLDIC